MRESPGPCVADGHILAKGREIGGGDDSTHQRGGERHALEQAKHTVSARHTDTEALRIAFGACVDAIDQALGQCSRAISTEARLESLADLLVFSSPMAVEVSPTLLHPRSHAEQRQTTVWSALTFRSNRMLCFKTPEIILWHRVYHFNC